MHKESKVFLAVLAYVACFNFTVANMCIWLHIKSKHATLMDATWNT